MILFRIQHKFGKKGVFRTDIDFDEQSIAYKALSKHNEMPFPKEEGLDIHHDGREWFCAYRCLDDLLYYNSILAIEQFVEKGFEIVCIDAKYVQVGEAQVIFRRDCEYSEIVITEDIL